MSINQLAITTLAVILTAFTLGIAAEPDNKGNAGKAAHEQRKDKPVQHQIVDSQKRSWDRDDHRDNDDRYRGEHRDDNDRRGDNDRLDNLGWVNDDYRGNENSNRQSDPDSTRGLERAAERRSDNADQHDRSNRESHWYDFIFGKDKVKSDEDRLHDVAEKKPRWWWPFD